MGDLIFFLIVAVALDPYFFKIKVDSRKKYEGMRKKRFFFVFFFFYYLLLYFYSRHNFFQICIINISIIIFV